MEFTKEKFDPLKTQLSLQKNKTTYVHAFLKYFKPDLIASPVKIGRFNRDLLSNHPSKELKYKYVWGFSPEWTWNVYFIEYGLLSNKRHFSQEYHLNHALEYLLGLIDILCAISIFWTDLALLLALDSENEIPLGRVLGANMLARIPLGISDLFDTGRTEDRKFQKYNDQIRAELAKINEDNKKYNDETEKLIKEENNRRTQEWETSNANRGKILVEIK